MSLGKAQAWASPVDGDEEEAEAVGLVANNVVKGNGSSGLRSLVTALAAIVFIFVGLAALGRDDGDVSVNLAQPARPTASNTDVARPAEPQNVLEKPLSPPSPQDEDEIDPFDAQESGTDEAEKDATDDWEAVDGEASAPQSDHGGLETEQDGNSTMPTSDDASSQNGLDDSPKMVQVDESNLETELARLHPKKSGEKELAELVGRQLELTECDPRNVFYKEMQIPSKCFNFNLFFIKGPKVGSSTMGGIARRVAARFGVGCVYCRISNAVDARSPKVYANHVKLAKVRSVQKHLSGDTFRFSLARDPAERCLSEVYAFRFSKATYHKAMTGLEIVRYAKGKCKNTVTKYMDFEDPGSRSLMDFVGITERYNESLLVMAYMIGLSIGDLLYIPAKVSAEQRVVHGVRVEKHIPLKDQPQFVQDYFKGEFLTQNKMDYDVYYESNARLDKLIQDIGVERFGVQLAAFKAHLATAGSVCSLFDENGVRLHGYNQKCYYADNGCAYHCLNRFATENGLWTPVHLL